MTAVLPPLSVSDLVSLHDRLLEEWGDAEVLHSVGVDAPAALLDLVAAAHRANREIWRLEDEARRRDVGDERISALKRAIDPWNQTRNDLVEAVDAAILAHFANVDLQGSRLHSETAGMMIDRLSILALKIANVAVIGAEARESGDRDLEADCRRRGAVLRAQREDLAGCLAELLAEFAAGRRHFKSYLQLKAYNDERFNAALRRASRLQPEKKR